jgi:membrane-bound serine protease (ClpP class)
MVWATIVALVAGGLVLLAVEVYAPGLVTGLIGVALLAAALFVCYDATRSSAATFGLLAFETVTGLAVVFAALKYFPNTPLGRKMNLGKTLHGARSQTARGEELIGRTGVAQTILRPTGVAVVDGRRLDVVAESGMIERGSPISIVAVQDNRIIVRKTES